jgi:hypothetical protein
VEIQHVGDPLGVLGEVVHGLLKLQQEHTHKVHKSSSCAPQHKPTCHVWYKLCDHASSVFLEIMPASCTCIQKVVPHILSLAIKQRVRHALNFSHGKLYHRIYHTSRAVLQNSSAQLISLAPSSTSAGSMCS